LKPDLTAPGWWTASAGSGNVVCFQEENGKTICPVPLNNTYHCTLKILRGTSMATPTTAGHAVLIRQYFTQGFYPTGRGNSSNGFTPSGALIKAVLIHSSQPQQYILSAETDSTGTKTTITNLLAVTGYPSNEQGYGRIQMNKVLNFGKSGIDPLTMFVRGASSSSSSLFVELSNTVKSHNFTFTTTTSLPISPVRVTMTWTDPPSTSGSNPMINHLDVTVYQVTGGGSQKVYNAYSSGID
jgi:hypothetical protein